VSLAIEEEIFNWLIKLNSKREISDGGKEGGQKAPES